MENWSINILTAEHPEESQAILTEAYDFATWTPNWVLCMPSAITQPSSNLQKTCILLQFVFPELQFLC